MQNSSAANVIGGPEPHFPVVFALYSHQGLRPLPHCGLALKLLSVPFPFMTQSPIQYLLTYLLFCISVSFSAEAVHGAECSDTQERLQQCASVQVRFMLRQLCHFCVFLSEIACLSIVGYKVIKWSVKWCHHCLVFPRLVFSPVCLSDIIEPVLNEHAIPFRWEPVRESTKGETGRWF